MKLPSARLFFVIFAIIYTAICANLLFNNLALICAYAQENSFGIRTTIEDIEATVGDIITGNKEEYTRSNTAFDDRMIGVYSETATVIYGVDTDPHVITTSGPTTVHVTTLNGSISEGDYLTSSPIAGYAQRSDRVAGYMLGVALENFDANSGTDIKYLDTTVKSGTVAVLVKPGAIIPSEQASFGDVLDRINALIFRNTQTPQQAENLLRYILAAIITLSAFMLSFIMFGRNISHGIEAMGRNPLARRQIQTMIIINSLLVVLICGGGIILSLAIIRF